MNNIAWKYGEVATSFWPALLIQGLTLPNTGGLAANLLGLDAVLISYEVKGLLLAETAVNDDWPELL